MSKDRHTNEMLN